MFDDELENTGGEEISAEIEETAAKEEVPAEETAETIEKEEFIEQTEADMGEPVTVQPVQFTSFDAT